MGQAARVGRHRRSAFSEGWVQPPVGRPTFGPFAVRRTCMGWAVGEPCLRTSDDGSVVTAPVGLRRANAWGLHDMHGNAAEWTRSTHRPYPYQEDDSPHDEPSVDRKVVRGGAWCDRPYRARSAFRLSYPAWQRVHNVGFRVVVIEPGP